MKKLVLATAIILATVVGVNAQINFGAKAGLNMSDLSNVEAQTESKMGLVIGAFAEVSLGESFVFQPELLFSSQGTKAKNEDLKILLNYVNIPLMAKYYVIDGLALEAGPQVGLLLSAEAKADKVKEDVKNQVETLDFGFNVGASYDITGAIFVGARYSFGLSDIIKVKESGDKKSKNSVFSFSVGYRF